MNYKTVISLDFTLFLIGTDNGKEENLGGSKSNFNPQSENTGINDSCVLACFYYFSRVGLSLGC